MLTGEISNLQAQLMKESREIKTLEEIAEECLLSTRMLIKRIKVMIFLEANLLEHLSHNGLVILKVWVHESYQTTDFKLCKIALPHKLENKCNLKRNLQKKISITNMGQRKELSPISTNSVANRRT